MIKTGNAMAAITVALFTIAGMTACTSADKKREKEPNIVKPARHLVEISMMKFTPASLNVHKGDTIVFVNNDIVTHDVTGQREKTWSSSPIAPGSSWELVATATVDYYCSIHPVMTGKVVVE